jgi:2,4-diaminopentanoate dehydrogenase
MPDRTYRVIQWATGSIGQIAIRHFAANPAFDLVGAYVTSEAKAGKDAGELASTGPLGVTATRDVDDILALVGAAPPGEA